jgi:siroheme synthase-like protein
MSRAAITGYPVNLVVAGRRCVVVGAGRIAARKVAALLEAGAAVCVVAPEVGAEVRGWADAGRLTLAEREFAPADLDDAWLATTATGDPAVDHAVYLAAEARGVWVNSADDPENCSFTLMSVVRQGDVVVTVGTGGRSPALAAWLKAWLEAELGPEYATLLDILADAREELQAAGRSTEDVDWRRALDSGMLASIRAGRVDQAKETLRACLWS